MSDHAVMERPSQDIANQQPTSSESAQMIEMIGRVAADPNTDISKMQALMEMRDKELARAAKAEFSAAFAAMQPELPAIEERGGIQNKQGGTQSTYALWEDINKAIKPVLMAHGFALSFRTDVADKIKVTAVLDHIGGHSTETSIVLPVDNTGSKNAVQATASSVSYGKRYTAGALLNLTSYGEDDDAHAAGCDYDIAPWTEKILLCKTEEELRDVSAEIKAEENIPAKPKTMIRNAWAGRLKELRKGEPHAAA